MNGNLQLNLSKVRKIYRRMLCYMDRICVAPLAERYSEELSA